MEKNIQSCLSANMKTLFTVFAYCDISSEAVNLYNLMQSGTCCLKKNFISIYIFWELLENSSGHQLLFMANKNIPSL